MKITIQNFRNIESETIEGSKIHIQWKNWSGKSNILHAFEWLLFATIHWSKTGIVPTMTGKESCIVSADIGGVEYLREPGQTSAFMDVMRRPIMFCNLLEQEYTYIKKTISDICIQEDAMKMFGSYRRWSIGVSITAIKTAYTEKNKKFLATKARTEFLQDEIDKRNHITPEWLEEWELKQAEKKAMLDKYTSDAGTAITDLQTKLTESQEALSELQKSYSENKLLLSQVLTDLSSLVEKWKKLTDKKCPTCWQAYESAEMVAQLREEYTDKKIESEKMQARLDSLEIKIKKYTDEVTAIKQEIDSIQLKSKDVLISKTTLEKELSSIWETTIKYAEALSLKNGYEEELQKKIDELIKIQQDDVFIINDYISPKGKLNQMLQEKLIALVPGLEMIVIEENEVTWEQKSVMKVFWEWTEYRELSRSQKLYVNILLSKSLMKLWNMNIPLLIDDAEMFSTTNINKLKAELETAGVEYIITKVCNCNLSITTL